MAVDAGTRILARVASSASLGILLILIARWSSVTAFGLFILAYTIGMVVGIAVGLGAPVRALRVASEARPSYLARSLYCAHTLVVTTSFAVSMCLMLVAGHLLGGQLETAMLLTGATFAFSDTLQNYAQSHMAGLGAQGAASILVFTQRLVPLVIVCVGTALADFSFLWVAAGFAIAALPALMLPYLATAGAQSRLIDALRGSGHYWLYSLSTTLSQLQLTAVAAVAPTPVVGLYAMAGRVTGPLTLLSASLATVLVPELAKRHRTGQAGRLYLGYQVISYVYLFALLILAVPLAQVVLWLVGSQYQEGETLIVGMVIAAGLSACAQAANAKLIALGHPRRAMWSILAGGLTLLGALLTIGALGHYADLWLAPIIAQALVLVTMTAAARTVGS